MSLLMDALKRAEKAKSRGNTAASLPIESVVSPLVEKNDHPEKKKESLMLEPVIKTGQDSEKEVELTFAIDNVEPLIGSTDTSESLFASDMSLFSVTPEQESKIINEPLSVEKKEVKAADINNKSTGVTTALFEKSVMTDQVSATPLQSPSDKVTADVNASLVRPQVPIMIGQPRFNRNYLWGGLLILCFVAEIGRASCRERV